MPISSAGKTDRRGTVMVRRCHAPSARWAGQEAYPTKARGITLLEMLVVVAIIGLMVGLAYPSLSAGLDSVRMVSATDSVAAFLNSAVTRAQRRQQAVALEVSPRENMLAMYTNEAGRKELKLPDGIFLE